MSQLIVVMGVTGCGKSTLGQNLAKKLNYEFIEGDDFHIDAAKLQMSQGVGLTDTQRIPWLERITEFCKNQLKQEKSLILACSALKQRYRSVLRQSNQNILFIWVDISSEQVTQRLSNRKGHFADEKLLISQFVDLEAPLSESDCIQVDGDQKSDQLLANTLEKMAQL